MAFLIFRVIQVVNRVSVGLDADGYKILCKPLLSWCAEIILL